MQITAGSQPPESHFLIMILGFSPFCSLFSSGSGCLHYPAAMGFTFNNSTKEILKVALLTCVTGTLALSTIQTIRKIYCTFMIASYLRVMIEPKLKLIKWETHLIQYRKKVEEKEKKGMV